MARAVVAAAAAEIVVVAVVLTEVRMLRRFLRSFVCVLAPLLGFFLSAEPKAAEEDSVQGLSFYEQRLLLAVEEMNALDAYAAAGDKAFSEVERRFRGVANLFNGIIANSPDALEARLIYGKMLDRYGDREGARDQFIEVLKRDHTVAVAHQQLGTYYAEENDMTRALAYYLTAIEYAPNEPVYHFALGDLLYTFSTQIVEDGILEAGVLQQKAFEAFGQAAALAPDNPVFHFRYGEALDQLADPDWAKALAHWEGFAEWPSLSTLQKQRIALHIARCLGELERYDEARERLKSVDEADLEPLRSALSRALTEAQM